MMTAITDEGVSTALHQVQDVGVAGHPVHGGQGAPPRAWRRALALIEARLVDLGALVTEVVSLDAWERVFTKLRTAKGLKYIFEPAERSANDPTTPVTRRPNTWRSR